MAKDDLQRAAQALDGGDYQTAAKLLKRKLAVRLDVNALYLMGVAYQGMREFKASLDTFDRVLAFQPKHFGAHYGKGLILLNLGRHQEAMAHHDAAVLADPKSPWAYINRGNSRCAMGDFISAIADYDSALLLNPGLATALTNKGNALTELGSLDEALRCHEKAIALARNDANAWVGLGATLARGRRYDAAEEACRNAIAIDPALSQAWCNLGVTLAKVQRYAAAEEACRKALEIEPASAEAWCALGATFSGLRRFEAAEEVCRKAVEIDPDSVEAWGNLGVALSGLARHDEAILCLGKGLGLDADAKLLRGKIMHEKMHACSWDTFDDDLALLKRGLEEKKAVASPFPVLALTSNPSLQYEAAKIDVAEHYPARNDLGGIAARPHGKIRIGYYSADFHNHATTYLMAELFEMHDRGRFELIAFSFGPDKHDEMRARVSAAFDRFIDVRNQSDKQVAMLSRELEIDIAVDLKGYTEDSRPGIFAYRAAPVQVNYLGYPGSMGAEYIDYLIADKVLVPEELQPYYSEKIVYLPDSYQPNDTKRRIADRHYRRDELGLPPTGFVFACFNTIYKLTPDTFDGWMRILKRVDGSVLWLPDASNTATANLRKEARQRGVAAERLVFSERLPLAEHLARICAADLFLDTLPCNAHTTASDALWAGLPILTQTGESFASRVAASLLHAMGLPELVTTNQHAYEELAVRLATEPDALGVIKERLADNRLRSPLFDIPLFTRNLEAAYLKMHARNLAGQAADHLYV